MPTSEQLKEWNDAFTRIERVDDYMHLKKLYTSVCKQIEELNEAIPKFTSPKNPREDLSQQHDKTKLVMINKQKTRLEKQLSLMEEQIKLEMEVSKKEL